MLRIGVLASHTGTNFEAIADACQSGDLNASLQLLICNNSSAAVMEKARRCSVPALHMSSTTDPEKLDAAICNTLVEHRVELVVLAGYMKKLGPAVLETYRNRIINVHPSLLPKHGGAGYYGSRVHQAVIDAGESETGATVHLVNDEYDRGEILLQEKIDVEPTDTADSLAERLRPVEHQMLINAIQLFSERSLEKGASHE